MNPSNAASGARLLSAVRGKMRSAAVSALIVPSADEHNSEYVAPCRQRRAALTNFHGSAGTAVVTADKALLWTDGRYWEAAAATLYPEFTLMRDGAPGVPPVGEWLRAELGAGAAVGVFPAVYTVAAWRSLAELVAVTPVEDMLAEALPPPPTPPPQLYQRPAEYCGATCAEKREALVAAMAEKRCELMVLSALDEVAWLTNLRGGDTPYNPVFYAYAVVDAAVPLVRVYVDERKVPAAVRAATAAEVEFRPYEQLHADVAAAAGGRRVLLDAMQTSEAVRRVLEAAGAEVVRVNLGPAQRLKAVKNDVELQGFRDCHVRDGAALTRFLAWLHREVAVKGAAVTEWQAAEHLRGLRAADPRFVQLSFETISAAGPNAAMAHYAPTADKSSVIDPAAMYLVDSGGQYWDGTTDVTRTVCFCRDPEPELRRYYTLVLQGHLALHALVFPENIDGGRIDAFARAALWRQGLDYAHGTGHGVGSFLGVHEGPHGVGTRPTASGGVMRARTIVSNEPGYYVAGRLGIRIENLEEVVAVPTPHAPTGFLGFRFLTRAPLCRDLIDLALLSEAERAQVDDYHAATRAALQPLLAGDALATEYLLYHTEPTAAW